MSVNLQVKSSSVVMETHCVAAVSGRCRRWAPVVQKWSTSTVVRVSVVSPWRGGSWTTAGRSWARAAGSVAGTRPGSTAPCTARWCTPKGACRRRTSVRGVGSPSVGRWTRDCACAGPGSCRNLHLITPSTTAVQNDLVIPAAPPCGGWRDYWQVSNLSHSTLYARESFSPKWMRHPIRGPVKLVAFISGSLLTSWFHERPDRRSLWLESSQLFYE